MTTGPDPQLDPHEAADMLGVTLVELEELMLDLAARHFRDAGQALRDGDNWRALLELGTSYGVAAEAVYAAANPDEIAR